MLNVVDSLAPVECLPALSLMSREGESLPRLHTAMPVPAERPVQVPKGPHNDGFHVGVPLHQPTKGTQRATGLSNFPRSAVA